PSGDLRLRADQPRRPGLRRSRRPPAARGRGSDLRGDAQHGLKLPRGAQPWAAPGALPVSHCASHFVRHLRGLTSTGGLAARVDATVERRDHHVCTMVSALHRCFGWLLSPPDRKSTRLNSSHVSISYAVFCLKKKNT